MWRAGFERGCAVPSGLRTFGGTVIPVIALSWGLRLAACSDFPVSPSKKRVSAVTVGAGSDRFLAAWIDLSAGSGSPALYCATVTTGGLVGQPDGVLLSAGTASRPELAVPARNQIAFDGTNFLVVWRDSRASYPGANAKATANIVAALVGQDGSVVKGEFLIGTGEGDRTDPRVVFNGESFVAAWTDSRGGSSTGKDIYWTFISSAGNPDPAMGKAWQAFSRDQVLEVLAAGASGEVMCVYLDSGSSPPCVRASRLTKAGTVRDPLGIKLLAHPVTAGDMGLAASATSSGGDYYVLTASRKDDNFYQHKVLADGTVQAATADSPLFNFGGTEAAYASGTFVSATAGGWIAARAQPDSSIRAKRVAFNGTDSDPALLLLNDAPVSGGRSSPAGAAMGTWYFAAWLDGRTNNSAWSVYGRVFDLSMAGSGDPAVPVPRISVSPATGAPPLDVALDGTSSSGNITAWEWDFGDNSTKEYTAAADHTYANAGVYTARLKVSYGAYVACDSAVIVVSAGGGGGGPVPPPD
ncbi:MAG: PKD domain-containing protein [Planctomycetota bacterium]|nr:PKD domain-containing protein [Planctomycetota bacterium]